MGVFDYSPYLGLAGAGILIFVTAYVFWHLIEKPFLKKSSHYVDANRG
jgi:peptidoglycan/LPS O-acetylase OafA/YrhL